LVNRIVNKVGWLLHRGKFSGCNVVSLSHHGVTHKEQNIFYFAAIKFGSIWDSLSIGFQTSDELDNLDTASYLIATSESSNPNSPRTSAEDR